MEDEQRWPIRIDTYRWISVPHQDFIYEGQFDRETILGGGPSRRILYVGKDLSLNDTDSVIRQQSVEIQRRDPWGTVVTRLYHLWGQSVKMFMIMMANKMRG